MKQKGFAPIIILVLIVLAVVGYFGYKNFLPKPQTLVTTSPIPTPLPSEEIAINKNSSPSPISSPSAQNYVAPSSWNRVTLLGMNLCLPPKWEADQWGNVYFNRDSGYRPNVTYIQEISYKEGSRREAYYKFWESEYPNVRKLVSVRDMNVNGNPILLIDPVNTSESKTSPEGSVIVWYASGKLWKAGIGNWSMVNNSKTLFLKDFYTMIGCSF